MSIGQLVLGTARFGLDGAYGFQAAKPDLATVEAIIGRAWDAGMRWLDTAEAYGDAEARLGQIGVGKWRIITKLAPTALEGLTDWRDIENAIEQAWWRSCRTLKVAPDGFLLHRAPDVNDVQKMSGFFEAARALKLRYWGVSCYTPEEAFSALQYGCTAIQVPHNLLDLRAWHAGVFVEAERRGATVFARSPFCQGLLTLAPDDPRMPAQVRDRVEAVRQACYPMESQAAFALSGALLTADHVVFGCETVAQLDENLGTAMTPALNFTTLEGIRPAFTAFGGVTDAVVNPSRFATP